jgi:hypothetical protein
MRNLNLPEDLCARVEKQFGDRFGTLEHFLECVLDRLLQDDAIRKDQAEQRIIEERLRDLGYL